MEVDVEVDGEVDGEEDASPFKFMCTFTLRE